LVACSTSPKYKSSLPITPTKSNAMEAAPWDFEPFIPDSMHFAENPTLFNLFQSWTHSREEDNNYIVMHYRPKDFKAFPPSRFRSRLVFNIDGTGEYLFLHPTDMHEMRPIKWSLDANDHSFLMVTPLEGGRRSAYSIQYLDDDELILERLKTS